MTNKILVLAMAMFGIFFTVQAQTDSIVFINGNYIVGEIKDLNRGVVTVETDYSDDDFKIEWDGISQIYSDSYFLFTLSDGRRFNGSFKSTGDGNISITEMDGQSYTVRSQDIVYVKSVKQDFWSKMSANIDLGYSFTKAQNLKQFNLRAYLGYTTDRWMLDGSLNSVISAQDSVETIRRSDGNVGYTFFLPKGWNLLAQYNFLSNTEQQLDLRSTGKIGAGYYILRTNESYWGFSAGVAYTNEVFLTDDPERRSGEAFIGSELNLFDIGDLNLLTNATAYPSLTEEGRMRVDFKFDVKYDLPRDFYIKLGTTVNYDNRPADGAPEADYVFTSGFGWEL